MCNAFYFRASWGFQAAAAAQGGKGRPLTEDCDRLLSLTFVSQQLFHILAPHLLIHPASNTYEQNVDHPKLMTNSQRVAATEFPAMHCVQLLAFTIIPSFKTDLTQPEQIPRYPQSKFLHLICD